MSSDAGREQGNREAGRAQHAAGSAHSGLSTQQGSARSRAQCESTTAESICAHQAGQAGVGQHAIVVVVEAELAAAQGEQQRVLGRGVRHLSKVLAIRLCWDGREGQGGVIRHRWTGASQIGVRQRQQAIPLSLTRAIAAANEEYVFQVAVLHGLDHIASHALQASRGRHAMWVLGRSGARRCAAAQAQPNCFVCVCASPPTAHCSSPALTSTALRAKPVVTNLASLSGGSSVKPGSSCGGGAGRGSRRGEGR